MVFYNDRSAEIEIDETFQKLWRSIPVQSIDEEKIQEYLDKQGITSVDDPGIRKVKYYLQSEPCHKQCRPNFEFRNGRDLIMAIRCFDHPRSRH